MNRVKLQFLEIAWRSTSHLVEVDINAKGGVFCHCFVGIDINKVMVMIMCDGC